MKVNKYDRQIRLWGQNGQKRLGEATVALLGASGVGIEALKNLVLPGVGHIEVWDEGKVELEDLSTCFFYAPEDVGRPRAEALIENLVEMNPDDVKGKAFVLSPLELLKDQAKLREYSLLVCGDLRESVNREVSRVCF
jgi:amyloid beta precursor protein binding protein 1